MFLHPSSVQQRHRRHAQTKKGANIKPNSGRKHKTSHWWALNPLRRKARRGCDENFCWGSCYFPINHQQSGRHLPRCVRFPLRTSISRCPRLSPFFCGMFRLWLGKARARENCATHVVNCGTCLVRAFSTFAVCLALLSRSLPPQNAVGGV